MAYGKKFKKNYRKKNSRYRRKSRLPRMLKYAELKTFDSTLSFSPTTTPTIVALSNIGQGDDYNVRQGRSIFVKSIQLNTTIELNASATHSSLRFVLFQQRSAPSDGSDPTATDICSTVDDLRNAGPWQLKRYKILWDRKIRLDNASYEHAFAKCFKKLYQKLTYASNASTHEAQNAIYLLHVSDEATNAPAVAGTARIRFYDF